MKPFLPAKPHLRLNQTRTGHWYVSLHHPRDKDYTLATTLNHLSPRSACLAARRLWAGWGTV